MTTPTAFRPTWIVAIAAILLAACMACDFAVATEAGNHRPLGDASDARFWLQNMFWHHRYSHAEIAAATGMTTARVRDELDRLQITAANKPARPGDAPLLVLPYPGGRHPRIGFLDGAIRPQRETKASIFLPWDDSSYLVADVPEAIWSNLGLTYLAHTHIPTIWNEKEVVLEPLEWKRHADGSLEMVRQLPNGITFGTKVTPSRDAVSIEQWLTNGTEAELSGLRVQNCVMLKGAAEFAAQSNDNKVIREPLIACRSDKAPRWVIVGWNHCHRSWANARCPCMHADPQFPDCGPGETQRVRGLVTFYEGPDIEDELDRLSKDLMQH